MPFFLGIEAFLAFAGAAFFTANFLFADCRVFIPCLFFGAPHPQVAHITSSSYGGQQSQILLACRLCLHQASSALGTSSLPYMTYRYRKYKLSLPLGPCQSLARPFSFHIHMLRTLFFTSLLCSRFCNFLFSRARRNAVRNFLATLHLHAYLNVAIPTRVSIFSHHVSLVLSHDHPVSTVTN